MPMFVKSYAISRKLEIRHATNDVETAVTRLSDQTMRAELLLASPAEWRVRGKPSYIHMSVDVEVDGAPDMNGAEFAAWLRDQIVEMLGGDARLA